MKRKYLGVILIGLFGMAFATPAPAQGQAESIARWDFDVYLNDKKVGTHQFRVAETGGLKQVQSEAQFKYTMLLIPVYRYEHSAAEIWSDECLVEIGARTNANGERIEVAGAQTNSGFHVVSDSSPVELQDCVMTFAYWNPAFLEKSRLLNPQTGEFVDVVVEEIGNEVLDVRGQPVPATRFRLTAYEIDMSLWYSTDDEWLALESVAKGGHVIRYELS